MNKVQVIKELLENGVGMTISVPTNGGGCFTSLIQDPNEVLDYIENRDAYFARVHGCSLREYLLWKADNYSVVCSATTSKGKPCKQIVRGGSDVDVKRWRELQGEYCWVHAAE